MAIKKYSPVTPGTRFRVGNAFREVTTSSPEKSLTKGLTKSGGRNHKGKMTMRQIGGGHKRKYRVIDFKRDKEGIPGKVASIEYDPNRTAFIALINYVDGEKRYVIAPDKLNVGDTIVSGKGAAPEVGNSLYLSDIPLGSSIHCIEMSPGKGAALARSAGTVGVLTGREGKYAIVKLPSSEVRRILVTCKATIGTTSNSQHSQTVFGKAGRKRWVGKRPRVRGVAMNPVDHPMGGGEGRSSGGHPRSRKGIPAKGFRTRSKTKSTNKYIIERRKK